MRGGVDVISWRSSLRSRFGRGEEGQWAQRDFDDERGRREWKRKRKRKLASLVGMSGIKPLIQKLHLADKALIPLIESSTLAWVWNAWG
jgi:hypothetical protein